MYSDCCNLQIQFVAIISHTSYNKFVRTDCDYPFLYNSITFYYTWSMMALFLHFFYTTYVDAKRARSAKPPASTSSAEMSANGHVTDSRNVQNNNLIQAATSADRKDQ